jgi:hypothetical protein
MADEKLPSAGPNRKRRNTRNEWVAADRRETLRMMATTIAVLAVLGLGLWLLVSGFRS